MDRYRKLEKGTNGRIGEGTYGIVYKAQDKNTGDIVALKRIRLEIEEEGISTSALREISLLRELDHKNIVQLQDCIESNNKLYMVFEFVEQDLKKYIDSCKDSLEQCTIQSFMHQLLGGLSYCHSRGIMHRDIKPQNLLISREGRLKIADFGLARNYDPPSCQLTHEVVTLWYRPPEILLGAKSYSPSVDIWACGTILVELAAKDPFFPGNTEIDTLYKMFRILGTPDEGIWPGVSKLRDWNAAFPIWPRLLLSAVVPQLNDDGICLLEELLMYDPHRRILAKKSMKHSYFKGIIDD